jgi:hypothetical protein
MTAIQGSVILESGQSQDATILRTPYAVRSRFWIDKLIEIGFLEPNKRHSAQAVEAADRLWRDASQAFLDP